MKVALRVSKRARRISLRINQKGEVILTRPHRVSESVALHFLERKKAWVLHHLRDIEAQHARSPRTAWHDGGMIPFLGNHLTISARPSFRSTFHQDGTLLIVKARPDDHAGIARLVEQWYRMQAEAYFHATCHDICARLGVRFHRLTIRGQSSRWGSCSKQGNLNFNWKLMMAPSKVAFSVAVHECCHLVHLNHSARFWNLVNMLCPFYDEANTWLKSHGVALA